MSETLNLASTGNSPDRSTKSTRSHVKIVLPQLVDTGFQVLFHSPPGVLFTFPSQYYALSVTEFRIRAFHALWTDFPNRSPNVAYRDDSPNPSMHARWFGLFPFRSPLLRKSNVSFSSSPYLDVSVQEVPNLHLWIQYRSTGVCPARFPHSEICGSKDICS